LLKPLATGAPSDAIPRLGDLPDIYNEAATRDSPVDQDMVARASDAAKALERRLTEIAATASKMLDAMKFDFLLDSRAPTAVDRLPRD